MVDCSAGITNGEYENGLDVISRFPKFVRFRKINFVHYAVFGESSELVANLRNAFLAAYHGKIKLVALSDDDDQMLVFSREQLSH
jgi:hypothetical protein